MFSRTSFVHGLDIFGLGICFCVYLENVLTRLRRMYAFVGIGLEIVH